MNKLLLPALGLLALLAAGAVAVAVHAEETTAEPDEIDWNALVDKNWQPQKLLDKFINENKPTRNEIYAEMERISAFAPVEPELDQKVVKMPGYVLPLEFSGDQVQEFLLLPYHGACIHVPAPPPNQVVYAKTKEDASVELEGMFAPVWVTGKISIQNTVLDLAEAAYTMEVYEVIPYEY